MGKLDKRCDAMRYTGGVSIILDVSERIYVLHMCHISTEKCLYISCIVFFF
jgi:hypothetical protein